MGTAKQRGMEAASAGAGRELTGAEPPQPHIPRDDHPIDGIARCTVCKRFPLVGEQVTMHAAGAEGAWVCETCESLGRGARLGEVTGSDRVRSIGGAANVHRAA